MAYGDFKDLTKRTASDKIFRDKAFNIAENSKHDGYQKGLVSMINKFSDKKKILAVVLQIKISQTRISWTITQANHQKV